MSQSTFENPANGRRLDLLVSPLFVVSTTLLLLNDFYLKVTFHNWLTGKLSDFAGLTAFALFACALWPRLRHYVAAAVTATFILWKSPQSQPVIDFINDVSPFLVGRTVDWSDLIALPVVWLVSLSISRLPVRPVRRSLVQTSAIVSIFAFTATAGGEGYRDFHETAQLPIVGTSGHVEAALEEIIDRTAANYRLPCRICDRATVGRLYTLGDPGSDSSYVAIRGLGVILDSLYFVINFDPSTNRVFYAVSGSASNKDMAAVRTSFTEELQHAFPGTVIARRPEITTVTTELGVYKGHYRDEQYLTDHERAVTIIDQLMHEGALNG
jgi:hypothetical protein